MISAIWLLPAVLIGVVFGAFLIALLSAHEDDDDK